MSSDPLDRDRTGRRRRRRGKKERERDSESRETTPAPGPVPSNQPSRTPIILAKPAPERRSSEELLLSKPPEKPIVMVKPREEQKISQPSSSQVIAASHTSMTSDNSPSYRLQRPVTSSSPTPVILPSESSLQQRLAIPPELPQSIKLVDESMQWCENGMEILLDQTHYFVIGVIGLQGVGKSTIMSLIAGANLEEANKPLPFKVQGKEVKEVCGHQTTGIDLYVTNERVILLDAQPVLSASVLDYMIHHDKKYPVEYTAAENCHEMQSLQITSFMYTVCNVVLIVQDWFVDPYFLRFLHTAEMLKPPTPSSSHESNSGQDDMPEYYPHVVFVQNRARRADFSCDSYNTMQHTLSKVFEKSHLKYRGALTVANGNLLPGLNRKAVNDDVNLFLLPSFDGADKWGDPISCLLPEYRGHPGFDFLMRSLKNQLLSMPRSMLTHTTLTEKNWFHYAARTWEAVKKSQLFSEYNRLLP